MDLPSQVSVTNIPMRDGKTFAQGIEASWEGGQWIAIICDKGMIGCTGNLFVGCECGGPGKPGVYWFSRENEIEEDAPFPDAGTWKSDCSMETDWSHSFINCTRHFASLLARDEWFDDMDPRPVKADQGGYIQKMNIAIVRSLRNDGAKILVKDITDGP